MGVQISIACVSLRSGGRVADCVARATVPRAVRLPRRLAVPLVRHCRRTPPAPAQGAVSHRLGCEFWASMVALVGNAPMGHLPVCEEPPGVACRSAAPRGLRFFTVSHTPRPPPATAVVWPLPACRSTKQPRIPYRSKEIYDIKYLGRDVRRNPSPFDRTDKDFAMLDVSASCCLATRHRGWLLCCWWEYQGSQGVCPSHAVVSALPCLVCRWWGVVAAQARCFSVVYCPFCCLLFVCVSVYVCVLPPIPVHTSALQAEAKKLLAAKAAAPDAPAPPAPKVGSPGNNVRVVFGGEAPDMPHHTGLHLRMRLCR